MGPRIADPGSTAGRMGRLQSFQCQGPTGRSDHVRSGLFQSSCFISKERGVDLFFPRDIRIRSGESTFGDRDWLCRSGYSSDHCRIGSGHLSIVRRYCDSKDDRFPSFYCCDPPSLVEELIAILNDQEIVLTLGWGELLLLSSVVLWVLYSRFSLSMLGQAHPVGGYGLTMIAGSVGLLLATLIAGFFGYELKQDFSFNSVMVVLFLGVFSTGLSVLLWLHGAKRLGVTTAGLHQNLVPVFVMLIMFILGEGFQWREGVGGLLVISGAIIAQLRKREST